MILKKYILIAVLTFCTLAFSSCVCAGIQDKKTDSGSSVKAETENEEVRVYPETTTSGKSSKLSKKIPDKKTSSYSKDSSSSKSKIKSKKSSKLLNKSSSEKSKTSGVSSESGSKKSGKKTYDSDKKNSSTSSSNKSKQNTSETQEDEYELPFISN